MILRIDRLLTELPAPSDPDPVGASAVQRTRDERRLNLAELIDGRDMKYTSRRGGLQGQMTTVSMRRPCVTSQWQPQLTEDY